MQAVCLFLIISEKINAGKNFVLIIRIFAVIFILIFLYSCTVISKSNIDIDENEYQNT